jgi:alkanesulfonate monooxygenase SsuD/methylene tetrahydromethanopterin reductase-like flavin-dependent oxidoreductase (luciferase family)
MARGYQFRWQNILCQKFGVTATNSDQGEADQRNRTLFNEHYKIMKLAWERDLLSYDGPTYQIPYPFEGIPNWPPAHTVTAKYGTPGEVDAEGTVKAISVVPKPYTSPHPQLFQAFGASPGTLRWCGEENVTPTMLAGAPENIRDLINVYMEGAESRGRKVRFGEGIGVCRTFYILEGNMSEDAARAELLRKVDAYEAIVWRGWYETFGYLEALRIPGEEGPVPRPDEHIGDRLIDSGMLIGGTVDQVKRQVEKFLEVLPIDYFVWLFHWGVFPREEGLRMLELFAEHIMPEFGMDSSKLEAAASA